MRKQQGSGFTIELFANFEPRVIQELGIPSQFFVVLGLKMVLATKHGVFSAQADYYAYFLLFWNNRSIMLSLNLSIDMLIKFMFIRSRVYTVV